MTAISLPDDIAEHTLNLAKLDTYDDGLHRVELKMIHVGDIKPNYLYRPEDHLRKESLSNTSVEPDEPLYVEKKIIFYLDTHSLYNTIIRKSLFRMCAIDKGEKVLRYFFTKGCGYPEVMERDLAPMSHQLLSYYIKILATTGLIKDYSIAEKNAPKDARNKRSHPHKIPTLWGLWDATLGQLTNARQEYSAYYTNRDKEKHLAEEAEQRRIRAERAAERKAEREVFESKAYGYIMSYIEDASPPLHSDPFTAYRRYLEAHGEPFGSAKLFIERTPLGSLNMKRTIKTGGVD